MRVHLHFPEAGSLKGKRAELNKVKALLRERLHVSVAEVGHQDSWQRSTLAVAIAARTAALAEETADTVARARVRVGARQPRGAAAVAGGARPRARLPPAARGRRAAAQAHADARVRL